MSSIRDGVLLLDDNSRVEYLDGNAKSVLGETASVGMTLAELWPAEEIALAWQQAKASGDSVTVEAVVGQDSHGDRVHSLTFAPLKVIGKDNWLLLLRDVTGLRRMESLQQDFVANVSHELRTPLTAIRMAAESLQMGAINDVRMKNKFLSNIQREADRMTRLVNEILVLAKIDGKMAVHASNFDPADLCRDVLSTMESHAELNDIGLVPDFPEHMGILEGDRDRLHQVLLNLVDNAVKCNRPNGTVTLKATSVDDAVEFQIIDTGIGIPPMDLPRIFERFFRVDKSRSRVTGGTGHGLSIVKDIIVAHGGNIEVGSELNVGTTFTIRLPRIQANPSTRRD
ncbi:MAG: PAS domain-containing protein [Candidatus Sericytochromatia bacterium]|nr:PAS domain-containing protein [Candidatus Sericytochromatia bacterium]